MQTANGKLEVGMTAKIVGTGPNRGQRGTITHLYTSGVFVGLVVVDEKYVAEGVNVVPLRKGRAA
jgi:hypothetical protein